MNIRTTYLGETFTCISDYSYLPRAVPTLVKNEKPVYTSSISPLWGLVPTKHTITTGMEIDSVFYIVVSKYEPYEVGVYDLIFTYSVNEQGGTYEDFGEIAPVNIYGQIVIKDFLTITA